VYILSSIIHPSTHPSFDVEPARGWAIPVSKSFSQHERLSSSQPLRPQASVTDISVRNCSNLRPSPSALSTTFTSFSSRTCSRCSIPRISIRTCSMCARVADPVFCCCSCCWFILDLGLSGEGVAWFRERLRVGDGEEIVFERACRKFERPPGRIADAVEPSSRFDLG
jgi:hypothetical protein